MSKKIKIGNRLIGDGEPCFIVAEAGVNHNGDPALAKQLIEIAAAAGAHAVKFQKRTNADILTKTALAAPYVKPTSLAPTYGEHRARLELAESVWRELKELAKDKGILFSASVWDPKSADFIESLGVPYFKISSADVTNLPLLEHVAKKGKPVILSTGMSTLEEIDEAVAAIQKHNHELILLHCVSNYPCRDDEVNLRVMNTLRERYGVPVGYSSHDKGVAIPAVAVALGANVIEKHFTVDRTLVGPDHAASLEPQGLEKMIKYIRHAESSLGTNKKFINEAEKEVRIRLAKSIVAKTNIPRGTVITLDMVTVKSPASGLKPKYIQSVCSKITPIDIAEDSLLPAEALDWPSSA